MTPPPEALFTPEGTSWLPTEAARGPWSPDALHGGPVAALLGRAIETCEPAPEMLVSRVTVELLRPVPLAPMDVTSELVRPGRRVQLVDSHLTVRSSGQEVARAHALRVRKAPDDLPASEGSSPDPGPDGPQSGLRPQLPPPGAGVDFVSTGAELIFVAGSFWVPGPATVWVRLLLPLVPGEEPSPLQRTLAAADFGNGVSASLDFLEYSYVNPDLTVYLSRPQRGEWTCLRSGMQAERSGTGLAQSELRDQFGPIGRSLQALYIEHR